MGRAALPGTSFMQAWRSWGLRSCWRCHPAVPGSALHEGVPPEHVQPDVEQLQPEPEHSVEEHPPYSQHARTPTLEGMPRELHRKIFDALGSVPATISDIEHGALRLYAHLLREIVGSVGVQAETQHDGGNNADGESIGTALQEDLDDTGQYSGYRHGHS